MEKFIIQGGKELKGEVSVSGAKNVALKALVAACLTDEEVVIENIPLISDFQIMADLVRELGGRVEISNHTARVKVDMIKNKKISLDKASEVRTSSMLVAPLLARLGYATIPNPGGCRIGARPIDRTIEGLKTMGTNITYDSSDGYFHAKLKNEKKLEASHYTFKKNTHTGTETLMIAATLADGVTMLENAAEEPEIDELITLLNSMGADIKRVGKRVITIRGVEKMHGTTFRIGPDRNEVITFAIAGIITQGDITVVGCKKRDIVEFLEKLREVGGGYEEVKNGIRFFSKGKLRSTHVTTSAYPGFMTDWQGPWAVLMTCADGESTIHETVYENRFGYVSQLQKMGAKIELFNPKVENPQSFYNFNTSDDKDEFFHGVKIYGPTKLHNAVVGISDLRAGATLVLAALAATGESAIFGIHHLDRGYEHFEVRLKKLGAHIKRVIEE